MLKLYQEAGRIEAGCDEAGRGCLAGPVYAAAVILPSDIATKVAQPNESADCSSAGSRLSELNDSKKLTEKQRYALREIIQREALAWAVGVVTAEEIDKINILRASILAMHRAVAQLKVRPHHLLVDGNRFTPYEDIPHTTVVKGDATYMSIAAASILAKTYRDDYMKEIGKAYPQYHWDKNKGYPAPAHREAIRQHGTTPHHRMTFNLLGTPQLELDFGTDGQQ